MSIPNVSRNQKTYVITDDLRYRIQSLESIGLSTPSVEHPFFEDFRNRLHRAVSSEVPQGVEVVTLDMNELGHETIATAMRLQGSLKDAIVVSTSSELTTERRGHIIEINRVVDCNGNVVGLGPRPGHSSLSKQFAGLTKMAANNSVVLMEDGAFTGHTVTFLAKEMLKHHINLTAIVVGICFPGALQEIRKVFDGEVIVMAEVGEPEEWMPNHDYMPCVPNCGRVFGGVFGKEVLPYYSHEGHSFSLPYVLPFGDPINWASIPEKGASRFSLFCLHRALVLFTLLNEMNNTRLTVHDLKGATPRVSVPMTKGSTNLPDPHIPIVEYLHDACHELC